jgi:rubrerythrin
MRETMTGAPLNQEAFRADIRRRLHRVRALIEHISEVERRHPDRADKLARERKAAEIDAGRLEGLLVEVEKEIAE